jgi:hypothetical protein
MVRQAPAGALLALAGLLGGLLSGCAGGPGPAHSPNQYYAEPADIITTQLAFMRLAREKGLAAAMKATAAPEARIVSGGTVEPTTRSANLFWPPAPKPEAFLDFLAHRTDSHDMPQWPVQQVWMSCDAAIAVTAGAQGNRITSITVWLHQKKGSYKWVLHLDDFIGWPPPAGDADMIAAKVADCPSRTRRGEPLPLAAANSDDLPSPPSSDHLGGAAADGTLAWSYREQRFTLRFKTNGAMQTIGAAMLLLPPNPAPAPPSAPSAPHH